MKHIDPRCGFFIYNCFMKNGFENIEHEILKDLYMSSDYLPMDYFEQRYGYTPRMIRIFTANLRERGFDIVCKRNKGFFLNDKSSQGPDEIFETDHEYSRPEIRRLIEAGMILTAPHHTSLSAMADRLFLSRTAVKKDIDELDGLLKSKGIILIRDVHGHRISLSFEFRMILLTELISEAKLSAEENDYILERILCRKTNYIKIFAVICDYLCDRKMNVSDIYVIRFTNSLILLTAADIDEDNEDSEMNNFEFKELMVHLKPFINLSSAGYHIAEELFRKQILSDPGEEMHKLISQCVDEFAVYVRKHFFYELDADDIQIIHKAVCEWIADNPLNLPRTGLRTEEIKKRYIESFDIAVRFRAIFARYHMNMNEADIASFAVIMNDVLFRKKPQYSEKVRVIIICENEISIGHHIRESIANTINPKEYSIELTSLFRFNRIAHSLNKEMTLVLDTGYGSSEACVRNHLVNLRVYPLMYKRDIEQIKQAMINLRARYSAAYHASCLRNVALNTVLVKESEDRKTADFMLNNGFAICHSSGSPELIFHVPVNTDASQPVLMEICSGIERQKSVPLFDAAYYIVKHFSGEDIRHCTDSAHLQCFLEHEAELLEQRNE